MRTNKESMGGPIPFHNSEGNRGNKGFADGKFAIIAERIFA